jgi:hypothetical protein
MRGFVRSKGAPHVTPKPSFEQYLLTAANALGFDDPANAERSYQFNLRAAHQSVTSGKVLSGILDSLRKMTQRYAGGNPNLLFYPTDQADGLTIFQKPFRSAIDKIYRRNIRFNHTYPDPPREGFIAPVQLYEGIDDLLRTRLVCKYMDGPKFVCDELTAHCETQGISSNIRELSTDAGYYAWHFYFRAPGEIMLHNIVELKQIWEEIFGLVDQISATAFFISKDFVVLISVTRYQTPGGLASTG